MSETKKGKLVIISGPSGVGKSTICSAVISQLDNVYLSVSVTSRSKSADEVDGQNYWFISRAEFESKIAAGDFAEHAEVFGNLYGTPKDKLDEAMAAGKTAILEIDVQGAVQIKELYPDAIMIFILPPKPKDLASRINGRGRDDEKAVERRLAEASTEIAAAWQHYKHMVINEDLDQAVQEVIEIINNPNGA